MRADILETHLATLNAEISDLRRQQQVILDLLKSPKLKRKARVMDKRT